VIRILIADDHAIVRKGLKQIVEETADMVVADEASTGHEVLDKVRDNEYDVVVLDISMPGGDGVDILKQIKKEKPKIPILVLSMHPEEQYAVRVLHAGAAGYMTKESAPDELITALRRVAAGRKYISSSLAEQLAFKLERNADRPLHEILSDREYQVMCMIASGKEVKKIAEELCLSVKTVSTYRSRILEKMRMKNNAELTRYAIKQQLVE
jgi:two-component system invasion response regulator UvrY